MTGGVWIDLGSGVRLPMENLNREGQDLQTAARASGVALSRVPQTAEECALVRQYLHLQRQDKAEAAR